ncbi:MAG: hypothetical protein BWK80_26510 [Desulfobacteraceae bacterium IS3]|nr:MAG: hypothetical protein BWK80_26510 [Desulfobacteraceae bacterium IS3]
MEQLFKQKRSWSTGCACFYIRHKVGRWYLSVAVKCQIGTLDISDFVLLDTGAEWSVIGGELAMLLKNELSPPIESFSMSTRFGRIFGSLHHINICLTAKQGCGNDLTVESSVFVSEEWEGPTVLGYRGFLEKIRFAFDPGVVPGEQIFYFGMAE